MCVLTQCLLVRMQLCSLLASCTTSHRSAQPAAMLQGRSGMSTSKLATHAAFQRLIAAGMCDNQDVFGSASYGMTPFSSLRVSRCWRARERVSAPRWPLSSRLRASEPAAIWRRRGLHSETQLVVG